VNGVGRSGIATNFNYSTTCNAECYCESAKLFPVCDKDGNPYFSPCHAGCRHVSVIDIDSHMMEFSECDCVPGGGVVKKGHCRDNCTTMAYAFFFTVVAGAFVAGTAVVPGMLILLRSVPPGSRSPALGLQGFLVSFGTMASPVMWGFVVDSACQIWDNVCDGASRSCLIYDPTMLRVRMHNLYVAIRLVSMLTDVYVLYHAKGLQLQGEEKDRPATTEEGAEAEKNANRESIRLNVMAE